jgi:Fe-S oxidoreductase
MVNKELIATTADNCRYCLMCRHLASVELVTHKETYSPHGWGMLIASVQRGLLEWNEDSVNALYAAPDNGNSRAHCVTDQPLPEIIAAVRADLVAQKLAPDIVYKLEEKFTKWQNPYKEKSPIKTDEKGEVALFVGDEVPYLWPGLLKPVLTLLEAVNISPVLIGQGRNNGYMASSLGLLETAKNLAELTISEATEAGAKKILVHSPGDYFTLTKLYEERLGTPWPEDVEIVEVAALIHEQWKGGSLAFKSSTDVITSFAYVDPTLAVRVPNRHEIPRNLINEVMPTTGNELMWRKERAHPVGNTALQFTHPDIADKLTHARLSDAKRSGSKVLYCDDAGTLHKLSEKVKQYNLKVEGFYETLAAQLA